MGGATAGRIATSANIFKSMCKLGVLHEQDYLHAIQ